MKTTLPSEQVRLMTAALETRDALRRLASKVKAANTSELQAEALEAPLNVATSYSELLKAALKDSTARRHPRVADRPPW